MFPRITRPSEQHMRFMIAILRQCGNGWQRLYASDFIHFIFYKSDQSVNTIFSSVIHFYCLLNTFSELFCSLVSFLYVFIMLPSFGSSRKRRKRINCKIIYLLLYSSLWQTETKKRKSKTMQICDVIFIRVKKELATSTVARIWSSRFEFNLDVEEREKIGAKGQVSDISNTLIMLV